MHEYNLEIDQMQMKDPFHSVGNRWWDFHHVVLCCNHESIMIQKEM